MYAGHRGVILTPASYTYLHVGHRGVQGTPASFTWPCCLPRQPTANLSGLLPLVSPRVHLEPSDLLSTNYTRSYRKELYLCLQLSGFATMSDCV